MSFSVKWFNFMPSTLMDPPRDKSIVSIIRRAHIHRHKHAHVCVPVNFLFSSIISLNDSLCCAIFSMRNIWFTWKWTIPYFSLWLNYIGYGKHWFIFFKHFLNKQILDWCAVVASLATMAPTLATNYCDGTRFLSICLFRLTLFLFEP